MKYQVLASVALGLTISALLFLPLVVWQYRRFGRFDGVRLLWTAASYIYASSIVAFTVFPLPDFSDGYCSRHQAQVVLDPLRFPRELVALIQTKGLSSLPNDFLIWEVALNVVLFVPFGFLVRRLLEWPRFTVFIAGLGTSALVELTQYTANWGLAPCAYRFADITDLFSNSTGVALGLVLERITPRLVSSKTHLVAVRHLARPVTWRRRVAGMVLDAWYLTIAQLFGATATAGAYIVSHGDFAPTSGELLDLEQATLLGAAAAATLLIVFPVLFGTGASLGQRTVYLRPVARRGARWRLLLRAVAVQGTACWLPLVAPVGGLFSLLWLFAALVVTLVDVRGLSGIISGCTMIDARAAADAPRNLQPQAE